MFIKNVNALLFADGYKLGHPFMMPKGTTKVYANITPRSVRYMPDKAKEVVVFGTQYAVKYIVDLFNEQFFKRKESDIAYVGSLFSRYLGKNYPINHFLDLWRTGYLPLKIKALNEGIVIREGIPILTITNTDPRFFWLPNYIESLISSLIWKPMHSAAITYGYRKIVEKYKNETNKESSIEFQCHDFSMRGMQSPESAISSGLAFATCFSGSDTVLVSQASQYYYHYNGTPIYSVDATEHSIMTSYGQENEFEAFEEMINRFPEGILSLVSDSYNLWNVITNFLPRLKQKIMSRNGKIVIRPDSGDPVDILCGHDQDENRCYDNYEEYVKVHTYKDNSSDAVSVSEFKGVVELLWDIFGGTINDQGYKVLDPHIGAIYGDAISLERCEEICERLKAKGFASTNVVFGVGSYSMSMASRDSQGLAMKTTAIEVGNDSFRTELREIFKDPVTDDGTKKSLKGLIKVDYDKNKVIQVYDQVSKEDEDKGLLHTLFLNGDFTRFDNFVNIRSRILKSLIDETV